MNLYQKIQDIANELMSIEKDMQVGNGNYAYKAVSDFSVTKSVKEAEKKHGVLSIPTTQELISHEIIRSQEKENKEKIVYSFIIKMTVLFINVDNPEEKLQVETFGHGLDSSDKGFGKASTYARKYALLNAYKIATGEDPDKEESKTTMVAKTISEKKKAVFDYLLKDTNLVQKTLQFFNYGNIEELSEKDINTMYATYKDKKLI